MKIDYDGLRDTAALSAEAVLGKDHPDIEDVVQETLIKVFEYHEQFRGESKLVTWASKIARNEALHIATRSKEKYILCANFYNLKHAFNEDYIESIEPTEVSQLLNQLGTKQRRSLQGFLEGKDGRTIGREMGLDRETVYRLQAAGKKKLKQIAGAIDV